MLNVSTFGNTADIYATVHLIPHACQHITVDQSHSSIDTVAKIWRLTGSGGTKTVSFTNPRKKKSHGVKSGDRGGHRINASSFFLCVLSTSVASFDWDTLARLCSEPENRLAERCNHYCLHSTVASASFLKRFTDLRITLYNALRNPVNTTNFVTSLSCSGVPRNLFGGRGVQQIQLRTEDRENGDLGAVAP